MDEQPIDDADEHVDEVGHVEELQGQIVIDPVEVPEIDVAHIADKVPEMDVVTPLTAFRITD